MAKSLSTAAVPDFRSRDRFQRAHHLARSPAERLAAMQRLIDEAWAVLAQHPAGLTHYRSRNFRLRAVSRSPEPSMHGT